MPDSAACCLLLSGWGGSAEAANAARSQPSSATHEDAACEGDVQARGTQGCSARGCSGALSPSPATPEPPREEFCMAGTVPALPGTAALPRRRGGLRRVGSHAGPWGGLRGVVSHVGQWEGLQHGCGGVKHASPADGSDILCCANPELYFQTSALAKGSKEPMQPSVQPEQQTLYKFCFGLRLQPRGSSAVVRQSSPFPYKSLENVRYMGIVQLHLFLPFISYVIWPFQR